MFVGQSDGSLGPGWWCVLSMIACGLGRWPCYCAWAFSHGWRWLAVSCSGSAQLSGSLTPLQQADLDMFSADHKGARERSPKSLSSSQSPLNHLIQGSKLQASLSFISDHKVKELWCLKPLCLHSVYIVPFVRTSSKGVKEWLVEKESSLVKKPGSRSLFACSSFLQHWVTFPQRTGKSYQLLWWIYLFIIQRLIKISYVPIILLGIEDVNFNQFSLVYFSYPFLLNSHLLYFFFFLLERCHVHSTVKLFKVLLQISFPSVPGSIIGIFWSRSF